MTTAFVVMGTTGEYSDRREWPVCGYADKSLADQHADKAQRWFVAEVQRRKDAHEGLDDYEVRQAIEKDKSPYDSDILCDYTGTDYFVIEVPMREALPEVACTP